MLHKRWLAVAVAACLGLSLTPLSVAHADDTPFSAVMPDANYRTCVTDKLGLKAGDNPTTEQLGTITELSCRSKSITDLTGTSSLVNLTKLFVNNNAITSVAPLSSSTKIFSLGLGGNKLTSIAGLAPLTKLSAVSVEQNQLTDISVFNVLPEYSSLSSSKYGQSVIGASATASVPTLVPTLVGQKGNTFTATAPGNVTVSQNQVTYPSEGTYTWNFRDPDDSYFNGSITVTVASPAAATTIPDDALRGCVNTRLSLDASVQPTVEQLNSITGTVTCTNKDVANLAGVNYLTQVTNLNLSRNSVSDVTPISAMANLMTLDISQNEVASLASLGSLTKLGTLRVNQTSVSTKAKLLSLTGVEKLTGLTSLNINYTDVSNLSPLANHPTLKTLDATNAKIRDITALGSARVINKIDLSANTINDISALKNQPVAGGLKVLNQTLAAPKATAEQETNAPSVVVKDGSALIATPPTGVNVTEGKVTYGQAGSYPWTFTDAVSPSSPTFSGTITQVVDPAPEPVVGVEIPDAGFRSCLAGQLGQNATDPITAEQLGGLVSVTCVGKNISDLTGAQYLTGATSIILSTNQISDVTPITGLPQVTTLLLAGNAISNPAPLASMTSLQTLSLSYNPISSIASVSALVNLTDLEVTQRSSHTGADLTSFTGVQSMTKLTRLVANNSSISDLSPVAGLTSLQRLYVTTNQVSDLTPLRNLTELTHLGLGSNNISDVSALSKLSKLESLDLASNHISDLSVLGPMPSMGYMGVKAKWQTATAPSVPAELETSVPLVRDLTGAPATMTPPAEITVEQGKVTYPAPGRYDWEFSATDDAGQYFAGTISQTVTEPVSGAANIPDPNLRSCLAVAAGLAADAVPTEAQVTAITSVDCSDRAIQDLTGAQLLTTASSVNLSGNPVSSISALSGLTSLVSLNLNDTGLSSVEPLTSLTSLTSLSVEGNTITDLSPLSTLSGLTTVNARNQAGSVTDVAGGVVTSQPTVTDRSGTAISLVAPTAARRVEGGVTFSRAGTYEWTFANAAGTFTGSLTQRVTSDVVDMSVHDRAAACVAQKNVWVVVERDTGLQEGGCATKFSTGIEALHSAGFTTVGSPFLTSINGYPSGNPGEFYWSYWHATSTSTAEAAARQAGTTYSWEFSDKGAADYAPQPGTIEGWRFISYAGNADPVAPSWTPVLALPNQPTTPPTSGTTTPTRPTAAPSSGSSPSTSPTQEPGGSAHLPGGTDPLADTGATSGIWAVIGLFAVVGAGATMLRRRGN